LRLLAAAGDAESDAERDPRGSERGRNRCAVDPGRDGWNERDAESVAESEPDTGSGDQRGLRVAQPLSR
jgi:hypothetical protein